MNYRHAFHAGGASDVFKHAVLVRLLERLGEKPAAFCFIDTHAGIGRYRLGSEEAEKTGEWRTGIARLQALADPPPVLAPYLKIALQDTDIYPGSPGFAAALLRPQDRAILAELHPEDAASLRRVFRSDARIGVHHRDGYEALKAFLPPRERRGLVLIDPPYEDPEELPRLAAILAAVHQRWPTGQYAVWYPVKHRGAVDRFLGDLAARHIPRMMVAEFLPDPGGLAVGTLAGSGMLLINPPWKLDTELVEIMAALKTALGYPKAVTKLDYLTPA